MVDALLGTGSKGEPRPPLDGVIDAINAARALKLAIDIPSGLDCDTGHPARHTVHADCTCTFVAPKIGFNANEAQAYLGVVHVLDIGAPRMLVESHPSCVLGLRPVSINAETDIRPAAVIAATPAAITTVIAGITVAVVSPYGL